MGLSMKMYANESKGQAYPPNAYSGGDLCDDFGLDFIWQGDTMYPEYLSDLKVNFCPSDSDGADRFEKGRWNCGGLKDGHVCPCRVDSLSYTYIGWTLDESDYLIPGMNANSGSVGLDLGVLLGTYVDVQFIGQLTGCDSGIQAATSKQEALDAADKDLSYTTQGGVDKVLYRIREGIERFLITDINNPAASAKSQSNISILFDTVSSLPDRFNHLPGGSNVLYVDGHCEFSKFPSKHPTSKIFAVITGGAGDL
jgi:prepilin-type processing-associated H-X9-DG protein